MLLLESIIFVEDIEDNISKRIFIKSSENNKISIETAEEGDEFLEDGIRRLVLKEWIKGRTDIKFIKYLTNKKLNSIDVGAYKGVYTYFISKYSRAVYAFEPNPKSYKILNDLF